MLSSFVLHRTVCNKIFEAYMSAVWVKKIVKTGTLDNSLTPFSNFGFSDICFSFLAKKGRKKFGSKYERMDLAVCWTTKWRRKEWTF